jgi:hypothetical protein
VLTDLTLAGVGETFGFIYFASFFFFSVPPEKEDDSERRVP